MSAREGEPSVFETAAGSGRAFPFAALHALNARCIDLIVHAARSEGRPKLPLPGPLRAILRDSTPEIRRRVAECGFLLLDMEFENEEWWRGVALQPELRWRTPGFHDAFARRTAVPLARSTLMNAWYSIQADHDAACIVLGMRSAVAESIAARSLSQLDQIADRRHRHLLPRWWDQPVLWHELFSAAQSSSHAVQRMICLHSLQRLTGRLLPNEAGLPR